MNTSLVGGGGGGSDRGLGTGGGGAGGVLTNMPLGTTTPDAGHARLGNPDYRVSPGSYTVKVGSGGVGGADNTPSGSKENQVNFIQLR